MQPIVSILIVSYNTREMTLECIRSVFEQTEAIPFELVVLDNASDDGSADAIAAEFPKVHLIASKENFGFARGNNIAATHAVGKYILLLNPDTIVLDKAIEQLVAFAQNNTDAGIWGGRTLFADRTLNPFSCWRYMSLWSLFGQAVGLTSLFRQSELFNPEAYGGWDRGKVRKVDFITGCFLLLERELWNQLEGFDESFFMYAEEADLSYRAQQIGWDSLFTPDATIIHYGGASETARSSKLIKVFSGRVHFIRKHWPGYQQKLGINLIKMNAFVRLTAYSALNRIAVSNNRAKNVDTWREIWAARKDWEKGYGKH